MAAPLVALVFGAAIVLVLVQLGSWILKELKFRRTVIKIPGPDAWPLIGKAREFATVKPEDRLDWYGKLAYQYNGIYFLWFGWEPVVRIRKAKFLESLLPNTINITKSRAYDLVRPWIGNGLITSTGQEWFHQRRMLTPSFHFGVLEDFVITINEKADILNECVEAAIRKNPNKPIDVTDVVVLCTLDVICETAMGYNLDAQRQPTNTYTSAVHNIAKLISDRFTSPWFMWNWYYYKTRAGKDYLKNIEIMHDFTNKIIREKKQLKNLQQSDRGINNLRNSDNIGIKQKKAFLDLLLEESEKAEKPLTDKEIREQVDSFMFAGHDTTTAAITWCLFALGNNPEIQKKVQEEIYDIFGEHARPSTTKEIAELQYLDRVLKEVLRVFPSVPSILRSVTQTITVDGYEIPKGATIQIDIMRLHRDPDVWENPDTFDPDRFLPENARGRHPYAFIPFSAGPRNCIGQRFALMEIKAILVSVLRKWNVKSVKKVEDVKMCGQLILRPADKLELYFTPIVLGA